jgi:hypothetical protein
VQGQDVILAVSRRTLSRLRRAGQAAISPFHSVGPHRIDLIAPKALEISSTVLRQNRLHSFIALRAPVHGNSLICPLNEQMEPKFPLRSFNSFRADHQMKTAIDRVMQTYGMLVKMTADQEQCVRDKVVSFLSDKAETDEQKLTIEGLRYVRALKL